MTTTTGLPLQPSRSWTYRQAERVIDLVDRRVPTSRSDRLERLRPRQWSAWMGHIAVSSLIVVIVSGIVLAFWYTPSATQVVYDGAYAPLRGTTVSEAYASTLDISFETRGGLLTRQIHYWSTHLFLAAMAVHLLHLFFTGAFRSRKATWLIALALMVIGMVGAYTGHGLPDDLLSGTGLRVVEGVILSTPIIGTHLSSFVFGGEYPGEEIISRLYVVHVVVIPALLVGLLAMHLVLARRRRQADDSGRRATQTTRAARVAAISHGGKAAGLMAIVVGVVVLMAAIAQVNPVWLAGPYDPSQAGAGSRPDWYMGFLDGAQRLMPAWGIDVAGHEVTMSLLVPAVVLPGAILAALVAYPWIEQWIVGDHGEQTTPDRPRDVPTRTAIGVGFIVFYLVLWIAGGNDAIATVINVPVEWVTRFLQVGLIVLPPLAFSITRRICLGMRRRDHETVLHGRETGVIVAAERGGFTEIRHPLNAHEARALAPVDHPRELESGPDVDDNGIPAPRPWWWPIRRRLWRAYFGDES